MVSKQHTHMNYEFPLLLIPQEICETFQESKQIGNQGHLKFFIYFLFKHLPCNLTSTDFLNNVQEICGAQITHVTFRYNRITGKLNIAMPIETWHWWDTRCIPGLSVGVKLLLKLELVKTRCINNGKQVAIWCLSHACTMNFPDF